MTAPSSASYTAFGFKTDRLGLPLVAFQQPVPQAGDGEIVVRAVASSPNPLDLKLANLNFLKRTEPHCALGFDVAGRVVAVGPNVQGFAVGDEVLTLSNLTTNGVWGEGGGYTAVQHQTVAHKGQAVSWAAAGVSPVCFLSAWIGLQPFVKPGDHVYIPGGAGGVGHFAVQLAARVLGATVISSCSDDAVAPLIRSFGATHVLNHSRDNIPAAIAALTGAAGGVDVCFDPTYSETSFMASAASVRPGGVWSCLGVGPGRTTRVKVEESTVPALLQSRGVRCELVNLMTYFGVERSDMMTDKHRLFLRAGLAALQDYVQDGRVVPYITRTVKANLDEINAEVSKLQQSGQGKVALLFA